MSVSFFTSESVTEGHPDKLADRISDAVLDKILEFDPDAKVACETLLTTGLCVVAGEVSTTGWADIQRVARDAIRRVGYEHADTGFDGGSCGVLVCIEEQSAEIRGAVVKKSGELGAGDQGIMFGYATDETPSLMPLPIMLANQMAEKLADVRKSGVIPYLRPDGKTQVTVEYHNGAPVGIDNVVVSAQHVPGIDIKHDMRRDIIEYVIVPVLEQPIDRKGGCYGLPEDESKILVNPSGSFALGGPNADAGVTGRKIIVDTYGGMARHGGGAFSGKDPSKVDRSASYAARWVAKNVVACGAARKCEVQIAYAIGKPEPTSLAVNTFGTGLFSEAEISDAIWSSFDLTPAGIISHFGLLECRGWKYEDTACYGHFGRDRFPWEKVDRISDLKHYLGLVG